MNLLIDHLMNVYNIIYRTIPMWFNFNWGGRFSNFYNTVSSQTKILFYPITENEKVEHWNYPSTVKYRRVHNAQPQLKPK